MDIIGYAAAFCTTFAFVPQAIKVIRTRNTRDLSLGMYAIFTMGITLWLIYGIIKVDYPIIVANVVSFVFSATILLMKIFLPDQG